LRDSVEEHGVQAPVTVHEGRVLDGHHRVLAALATGRDVPYKVIT
jgi:ParB-like chromosome segregation protein Spo0J